MVDGGVDCVALADIGDDGGGLASERFDFLANGVELIGLDVGQREISAFLCKPQRNTASDPLASAGYQNDFAIQRHDFLLQKVGQSCAASMFPFRAIQPEQNPLHSMIPAHFKAVAWK